MIPLNLVTVAYIAKIWTQVRLLPLEQSDLGSLFFDSMVEVFGIIFHGFICHPTENTTFFTNCMSIFPQLRK